MPLQKLMVTAEINGKVQSVYGLKVWSCKVYFSKLLDVMCNMLKSKECGLQLTPYNIK